jgi:hypothetical protein
MMFGSSFRYFFYYDFDWILNFNATGFKEAATYCANDVRATLEVYKKLFPVFRKRWPIISMFLVYYSLKIILASQVQSPMRGC